MTDFYLMSLEDPAKTEEVARSVGATFMDKESFDGLKEIGIKYHDSSMCVVDTSEVYAQLSLNLLNEGAQSAGTPYSLPHHINPDGKTLEETAQGIISIQPGVAVVAYRMEVKCGFSGADLIRRMRERERD